VPEPGAREREPLVRCASARGSSAATSAPVLPSHVVCSPVTTERPARAVEVRDQERVRLRVEPAPRRRLVLRARMADVANASDTGQRGSSALSARNSRVDSTAGNRSSVQPWIESIATRRPSSRSW